MTYCDCRSNTSRSLRSTSLQLRDFSAWQEVRNELSKTVHHGRHSECRSGRSAGMEIKAESAIATNGRAEYIFGTCPGHEAGGAATGPHPTDARTHAGHRRDVWNR